MGATGYDIALGLSGSSSAGASLNSPFYVTGGGGSSAEAGAPGPSGNWTTYLPWIVAGIAALGIGAIFLFRN